MSETARNPREINFDDPAWPYRLLATMAYDILKTGYQPPHRAIDELTHCIAEALNPQVGLTALTFRASNEFVSASIGQHLYRLREAVDETFPELSVELRRRHGEEPGS